LIDPGLRKTYWQFKALWPTLLWAYVPTLVVIGGITIFALATGRRVWYLTNDPFVLGNLPFYAGVLSSLAMLVWGAGATVCFFSALVLVDRRGEERGAREKEGRGKKEEGRWKQMKKEERREKRAKNRSVKRLTLDVVIKPRYNESVNYEY